MTRIPLLVLAAAALSQAAPAAAHQTVTSNGARVTLHVDPDDEPEAGRPATIRVLAVRVARRATFRYRTCRCRLRISDSSGTVLRDARMRRKSTFTFPRAGAYRLTYSGRYRRAGKTRRFSASFAIRAF